MSLLSGFVLALRGPVTFAGRDAYHVVATPSPSAAVITPGLKPLDRIEVFVAVDGSAPVECGMAQSWWLSSRT